MRAAVCAGGADEAVVVAAGVVATGVAGVAAAVVGAGATVGVAAVGVVTGASTAFGASGVCDFGGSAAASAGAAARLRLRDCPAKACVASREIAAIRISLRMSNPNIGPSLLT